MPALRVLLSIAVLASPAFAQAQPASPGQASLSPTSGDVVSVETTRISVSSNTTLDAHRRALLAGPTRGDSYAVSPHAAALPDFIYGSNFEDGNCGFDDGVLSPVLPYAAAIAVPCPVLTINNGKQGGGIRGNAVDGGDGVRGFAASTNGGNDGLDVGVVGGGSGGSDGVVGVSDTGNGVYGQSQGTGVWGISTGVVAGSDGIHGVTSAGIGQGSGVAGFNSSSGNGVFGLSFAGNGAVGVSSGAGSSGVAGINTGDGFGIYSSGGKSTLALYADGTATQRLDAGGMVKFFARVHVDPSTTQPFLLRCFNSQLPADRASVGTCGFDISDIGGDKFVLDVHQNVSNRFPIVTVTSTDAVLFSHRLAASAGEPPTFNLGSTQIGILVFDTLDADQHTSAYQFDVVVY